MGRLPSYTLSDLESRSGFDKRTIAYYISEGLLPKVGRRGRNTTYPQEFMERLMFIRRVRDMQDDGQLRAVTLAEIRSIMQELTADEIRRAANSSGPIEWVRERFTDPDWDTSGLAVPAEQVAASMFPEPDLDRWENNSVIGVEDPYKTRRTSASRRRDSLKEQITNRQSFENSSMLTVEPQAAMEKPRAIRDQEIDELKAVIHPFGQRTDQIHDEMQEMRKELQYELREMKDLVLGLHKRLNNVEERIKPDPETDEDDSDSDKG